MAKLCLNMVVRNDVAALARCLASLDGVIDAYVVIDAGSTDGSGRMVADMLGARGVPGVVEAAPFRSFAQVRNDALAAARRSPLAFDYLLFLDPGLEVVVDSPRFRDGLDRDSYLVPQHGSVSALTRRMLRRTAAGYWRGAAHEFLETAGGSGILQGLSLRQHARAPDPVATARENARLLAGALALESDPMMRARYTFYLGNALATLGDLPGARARWLERAGMGFWEEEVYCARLYAARAAHRLGAPQAEVLGALADLHNEMPHRAEAVHGIARILRESRRWDECFAAAEAGLTIERPREALFHEDWIYAWGLADEYAVACHWTGRFREASATCDQLLLTGRLPAADARRVAANRDMAIAALSGRPVSA